MSFVSFTITQCSFDTASCLPIEKNQGKPTQDEQNYRYHMYIMKAYMRRKLPLISADILINVGFCDTAVTNIFGSKKYCH